MLRESETLTNGLLTLSVAHVFNPYRELASAGALWEILESYSKSKLIVSVGK